MKRIKLFLLVALTLPSLGKAAPYAGAQLDVLNFFILPSNTGLSTKSNFGLGGIFVGYSLGDILGVDLFLSKDNTGTLSGSGSLYGQTGTIAGKFKTLSYGVEARLDPPFFPLFLKAGVGLGSLTSDVLVGGQNVFNNLDVSMMGHLGTGLSLSLPMIKILVGLDAVYFKIKANSTSLTNFVFFRTTLGAIYTF